MNSFASKLTAFSAVAFASSLVAQTTPTPPPDDVVRLERFQVWAESAAPSQISVTSSLATKTSAPLLTTPQSIQVLNRALLDDQDARTLSDALVNVSGVIPAKTAELVLENPLVRGFSADVYVDGLPAFGSTATIDPASLVSVERVEVAKGPTATLFGGGIGAPLGGLINLVSKSPDFTQRSAALGLRYGSYKTFSPSLDFNQPLGRGQRVAFRLTADHESAESHIDAVELERYNIQPSLAAKLTTKTDLVLRAQFSEVEQLEYSGLPAPLPAGIHRYRFSGSTDAPYTSVANRVYSAELTHRFSPAVVATLAARRYANEFEEYSTFIFPAFFPPFGTTYTLFKGYLPTDVDQTALTANLRADFTAASLKHSMLAGIDYDHTDYWATLGFEPFDFIDYADRSATVPFGATTAAGQVQNDLYRTTAFYVQDQITLPAHVTVLGGLRYSKLDLLQRSAAVDEAFEEVTPRLGLAWEYRTGASLFAGYSEGFRAPLNFIGAEPAKPETSRSYEAGLKFALNDHNLHGTVALYELTRANVPVADPVNLGFSVQTGEQRARGFETDLIWEPIPALSVLAAYAYTDAEVTRDTNALLVGAGLPRVPLHSGRIAARYRFLTGSLKGLEVGLGLTGATARQITLPNEVATEGYLTSDFQASYAWDRFSIGLSVTNLTNEEYFEPYQFLAQSVAFPAQPRAAFLNLQTKF